MSATQYTTIPRGLRYNEIPEGVEPPAGYSFKLNDGWLSVKNEAGEIFLVDMSKDGTRVEKLYRSAQWTEENVPAKPRCKVGDWYSDFENPIEISTADPSSQCSAVCSLFQSGRLKSNR